MSNFGACFDMEFPESHPERNSDAAQQADSPSTKLLTVLGFTTVSQPDGIFLCSLRYYRVVHNKTFNNKSRPSPGGSSVEVFDKSKPPEKHFDD